MYSPAAFAESDRTKLHAFMEQNSFALLVSQVDGKPFASHLPLLLDRKDGANGCLLGHMARANSQWMDAQGQEVLVVFAGPHAYISPTWYDAEKVVPTWNYVAVHTYGRLHLINDPMLLIDLVDEMVGPYEQSLPRPWTLRGAGGYVEKLEAQVVGFRIDIERIEGKWKLSQNHPPERRCKVIQALEEQGNADAIAVAALMKASLVGK